MPPVAVYPPADVMRDLTADLQAQVSQGDQLAPGKVSTQPCQVTQAADDGTVILSCAAADFSQPIVDLPGLKTKLAGKQRRFIEEWEKSNTAGALKPAMRAVCSKVSPWQ